MTNIMTCPACNYTRQPTDDAPEWECPKCQKAYNKIAQTAPKGNTSANLTSELLKFSQADLLNYSKLLQFNEAFDNNVKQLIIKKINDPMVSNTKWLPISRVNGSFRLKQITPSRLEFQVTTSNKLLCSFFILIGMVEAISVFMSGLSKGILTSSKVIGTFIISGLFVAAGVAGLVKGTRSIIFDIGRGSFWKSKHSDDASGGKAPKIFAKLSDIYALQIIPVHEPATGSGSAYYNYELNLVLNNGERISVINNNCRETLVQDTVVLAKFLQRPVWDAIDYSFEIYKVVQNNWKIAALPLELRPINHNSGAKEN